MFNSIESLGPDVSAAIETLWADEESWRAAVGCGDFAALERLYARGLIPCYEALKLAMRKQLLPVVRWLMDRERRPPINDCSLATLAAKRGNAEILQEFLNRGYRCGPFTLVIIERMPGAVATTEMLRARGEKGFDDLVDVLAAATVQAVCDEWIKNAGTRAFDRIQERTSNISKLESDCYTYGKINLHPEPEILKDLKAALRARREDIARRVIEDYIDHALQQCRLHVEDMDYIKARALESAKLIYDARDRGAGANVSPN